MRDGVEVAEVDPVDGVAAAWAVNRPVAASHVVLAFTEPVHLLGQLPDHHQQRIDPSILGRLRSRMLRIPGSQQREQLLTRQLLRPRHPRIQTRSPTNNTNPGIPGVSQPQDQQIPE